MKKNIENSSNKEKLSEKNILGDINNLIQKNNIEVRQRAQEAYEAEKNQDPAYQNIEALEAWPWIYFQDDRIKNIADSINEWNVKEIKKTIQIIKYNDMENNEIHIKYLEWKIQGIENRKLTTKVKNIWWNVFNKIKDILK